MTDTKALKEKIRTSGITITAIARRMGITRECLYQKIQNRTEFKASEIASLGNILRLSQEERDSIFFSQKR